MQLITRCASRSKINIYGMEMIWNLLEFSKQRLNSWSTNSIQENANTMDCYPFITNAYWVEVQSHARVRTCGTPSRTLWKEMQKKKKENRLTFPFVNYCAFFIEQIQQTSANKRKRAGNIVQTYQREVKRKWKLMKLDWGATVFLNFIRDRQQQNWLAFWWSVWIEQMRNITGTLCIVQWAI